MNSNVNLGIAFQQFVDKVLLMYNGMTIELVSPTCFKVLGQPFVTLSEAKEAIDLIVKHFKTTNNAKSENASGSQKRAEEGKTNLPEYTKGW